MLVQLNKCVVYGSDLQIGHSGDGCDQCDKPPSWSVLSVCAFGGVVGYFW